MENEPEYTLRLAQIDGLEEFWVINDASKITGQPTRPLFVLKLGPDDQIPIVVEMSFAPQNLAEYADKDSLLKCAQLRQLLAKDILRLISPKQAIDMQKDKDVRIEMDRLKALKMSRIVPNTLKTETRDM